MVFNRARLLGKQGLRHLCHVTARWALLVEGVTLDDARAARHPMVTWRSSLLSGTEAFHGRRLLNGQIGLTIRHEAADAVCICLIAGAHLLV